MAFDGLSLSITGDSGSAKAALQSVKSSLGGLSRQANDAQDSVEELGDSASGTSTRLGALGASAGASLVSLLGLSSAATGASGSLSALAVSTGTVSAALGGLVTIATPLVATLGGVVAAATGLAGAFSAVVGSGLVAFGEKRAEQNQKELEQTRARIRELEALQDSEEGLTDAQAKELRQLEEKADKVEETTSVTGALGDVVGDLKAEITPLVAELGQKFIPLIEDAVAAIPALAEDVIDALGPLDSFRAALRDFGAAAATAIPVMVGMFTDLAREALPVLRDLVTSAGDAAPSAFQRMLEVTREIAPLLLNLGSAAADLLPPLLEIGTKLLSVVTPAVTGLVETLGSLLDRGTEAIDSFADTSMDDVAEIFGTLRDNVEDTIPKVVDLAEEFEPLFAAVLDALPNILDLFGDASGIVLDLAEDVAERLVPPLTDMIEIAGDLASRLDGRVVVALGAVAAFAGPLSTVAGVIGSVGATVASVLPNLSLLSGAVSALTGLISGAAGLIPGLTAASGILGSVGSVMLTLATGPVGILAAAIGGLVLVFKKDLFGIQEITREAFDALDKIIGDFTTWLKTKAPGLVRKGFKAVGSAIRTVALDVYNAVTGNGDSILRNVIGDFVSYLKNDAPGDLKTAINIAFDVITAAARGLYRGLVGNSILKDIIRDFGEYLRSTAPSVLKRSAKEAFDGFVSGITSAFDTVAGRIEGALSGIEIEWPELPNWLQETMDFLGGSIVDALEYLNQTGQVNLPTGEENTGGGGDGGGGGGGGGGSVGGRDPDDPADAPSATPPGQVGDDDPSYDPGDDASGGIGNPGYGTGLATGGLVEGTGAAMLHAGERVLPESQVSDRGEASFDPESVAKGFDNSDAVQKLSAKLDRMNDLLSALDQGDVAQKDVLRALDVAEDRRDGRDPFDA